MRLRAALPTLLLAASLGAAPVSAHPQPAPPATQRSDGNPLAGRAWGVYRGKGDQAWEPYLHATGKRKKLLAKIALRPKAKWYGAWIPDRDIEATVRKHVAAATGGDPEVLFSAAVFRMVPWEHEACDRLPTQAEQRSYKTWIRGFARGIGDTHAMLVLQPDGPFARCAPRGSQIPSRLIAWSAKVFSALPNTHVYLDAGASDWLGPDDAAKLLVDLGVEHTRGFALNVTHYDSPEANIRYGAQVAARLAARGLPGKRAVIDTSQSGRPFTHGWWEAHPKGRDFDDAAPCRTATQQRCVTLGIPPTTAVTSPATGLPADVRALAGATVDAFIWSGRPWLYFQATPFLLKRALQIARTTPY
jgi:endoglucanase